MKKAVGTALLLQRLRRKAVARGHGAWPVAPFREWRPKWGLVEGQRGSGRDEARVGECKKNPNGTPKKVGSSPCLSFSCVKGASARSASGRAAAHRLWLACLLYRGRKGGKRLQLGLRVNITAAKTPSLSWLYTRLPTARRHIPAPFCSRTAIAIDARRPREKERGQR